MLDNFSPEQVRSALSRMPLGAGRPLVEISGGIRLETIASYAVLGVDVISVGALTHSAPALDVGLDAMPC
jgi:nicotinate-nucleotide pyrophosphorylase (carboxylating)